MNASLQPICRSLMPIIGLIVDLGGTNVRLALAHSDGTWSGERVYRCKDYSGIKEVLRTFEQESGLPLPNHIALCFAGPVISDQVLSTNLGWHFSVEETRQDLGVSTLRVVNDFVANALACPTLTPDSLVQIGTGTPWAGFPIGAIGPGTGLGAALLVPDPQGGWIPVASEGGHVTLAASTQREWDIINHLADSGHVSGESVISGQGLESLHRTIRTLEGLDPLERKASDIADCGLSGTDPLCREALDIMCAMLGTLAGNLALTTGSFGGVYILGGILPQMVDFLKASQFRERFESKGRLSSWMKPIPTLLVTHPFPAFPGLIGLLPR